MSDRTYNSSAYNTVLAAKHFFNLTAAMVSDTVDLDSPLRQLKSDTAGDIAVMDSTGSTTIFYNQPAHLPITGIITRVLRTGTTATLYAVNGAGHTKLIGLI